MLEAQAKAIGDVTIYTFTGSFDSTGAATIRQEIVQAINQGQRQVILNFAGVDFLDSTGLGYLVSILKSAINHGGKLRLCHLEPMLKDVFILTKLDRVFDIDDDEAAALAQISA